MVAGCGGGGGDPAPSGPVTAIPAANQVPTELRGSWSVSLGPGDIAVLTLTSTTYRIDRGTDFAVGDAGVTGDRLQFSNSSACAGLGEYRWTLVGSSLSFSPAVVEACPGRGDAIANRTYGKTG